MKMLKGFINPMKGWGNSPYLIVKIDRYESPKNAIYTNTENCYWYQDKESGLTDFLFHITLSGCKEIAPGHFSSPKDEGFGGRTFTLNLSGGRKIDLNGPWSGGSYCANQYLPENSIETTFLPANIAGYLTWEAAKRLLPTGWDIIDSRKYSKHWPELTYEGQVKSEWAPKLLEKLHREYLNESAT
jgi:hypothetical protein